MSELEETGRVSGASKLLTSIVYAALGIIGLGIAITLYWLVSGNDALEVKQPVPVQPLVVESQEKVVLYIDYCKYTGDEGRIIRRFVSSNAEVFAPTIAGQFKKGCYENEPVEIPIPDSVQPGIWRVNYRITYKTNPLKEVIEDFTSEAFEVTPRE